MTEAIDTPPAEPFSLGFNAEAGIIASSDDGEEVIMHEEMVVREDYHQPQQMRPNHQLKVSKVDCLPSLPFFCV